jgi:hypothetical protein
VFAQQTMVILKKKHPDMDFGDVPWFSHQHPSAILI